MREIIKKGNSSPESEGTSTIKLNSSSTLSYTIASGTTESSREECANLSSNLDEGSNCELELGCYHTGNTMVVKQEGAGLDIKPDPDTAASPTVMNGEDSVKNNMNANLFTKPGFDSKIKLELANGNVTETDMKPNVSDTGIMGANINSSNNCTTPSNTSPQALENSQASNEVGKSSSAGVATSDAQYMQQQSQIFVFTTALANSAAEEVINGSYANIIQYHCSLPATMKLLEKHPLKTNQFSKSNPPQWLNNMTMKGSKTANNKQPMPAAPICEIGSVSSYPMRPCMGSQQGDPQLPPNMMINPIGPNPSGGPMIGPGPGPMSGMAMSGSRNMMMHPSGMPNSMGGSPMVMAGPGSINPRMQGSSEGLTPAQRQHREEQMNKIKHIESWFDADSQSNTSNCLNNSGMPPTQQGNNNNPIPCSVSSQAPSLPGNNTDATSSNSLPHQNVCSTSNPCVGPTPNACSVGASCSMQGSCTTSMQGSCSVANSTSCSGSMSESCSNSMMPAQNSMTGASGMGACSNPSMNGNCGLPMPGRCSVPMQDSCSNVISSPVSLQSNSCSGPLSCSQTSTVAQCTISGSTNCQTNTSAVNPMGHNQPLSNSSQNNMNIGPSPVPGMGPSPGLGHSPNMGPSPVMMGPGMGMGSGMMGPFGPMGSQPNMLMGQGPMSNNMMGPSQAGMMGPSQSGMMGPGLSQMRMMGPGNHMMMGGPNSSAAAQMEWQRSMAEQMELKRKKGQMHHDMPMAMMGPGGPHMGGPMMGPHMMGGPIHGNMGMMPGGMRPMGHGPGMMNRIQGPPPPYHGPGPRPMGNGPVHSPDSPSMCPITSPRMPNNCAPSAMRLPGPGSGMDSPRPSCSNPPTPVSSGSIASPSLSLKDQPTHQPVPNDMPFGRQLQNFAQQKQQSHMPPSCGQQMSQMPLNVGPTQSAEPSLMPVPSPQQIQYLNTFDGQELTIQKQPNTSLRETDMSPMGTLEGSTDNLTSLGNKTSDPTTPQAGPSTPHTPLTDTNRYNNGPQTPDRFPVPSPGMAPPSTPHTPQQNCPLQENKSSNSRFGGRSPQSQPQSNNCGPKTPSMDSRFPVPSPKTPSMCGGCNTDPSTQRFLGASPLHSGSINDLSTIGKFSSNCPTPTNTVSCQKMGSGYSPGKITGLEIGSEFNSQSTSNLPLDPTNSQAVLNNAIPGKALDPISSMAQMSQQLGSSGQPGSPPISSASTPTLPIVAPGLQGPANMIDNQGPMMGIPPVSSSPTMMGGPVPSPVSSGPRGSPANLVPTNIVMMPGNPRMMVPVPRQPGPNGSTNVSFNVSSNQVKVGSSNTMHYMPRPSNSAPSGGRGPPNIEYIQRFNTPIGLEKPVSPMFSNSSGPNNMCVANVPMQNMSMSVPCGMGGPMCPTGPMNVPGPMVSMAGQMPGGPNVPVGNNMTAMTGPSGPFPMNGPSGHVSGPNGPMGMVPNGPMTAMGPTAHMMGHTGPMMISNGPMGMNPGMMSNGPMGPNGQMMGPRGMTHMMRGPAPAGMMGPMGNEMYGMNGPPGSMTGAPMGSGAPSSTGHPVPNQMMPGSAQMFTSKGSPNMGMGSPMGSAPDTAQPLPPSMGQSGNYKNAHFMVPTTADPNYAVQFHNFQQQLYATNTRGPPMGSMGGQVMPGGPHCPVGPGMSVPGHMVHQFPFNPK